MTVAGADSPLASHYFPEPNHSGYSNKAYVVVHDIECPPGKGWAESLGGPNWLQNPATQASVHYIVDGDSIVQGLPESLWAWGAGTPGSAPGIHIEQAGYATFTRAMWLGEVSGFSYDNGAGKTLTFSAQDAADMKTQMDLLARLIADIFKRHGWSANAGWMTSGDLQTVCNHGGTSTKHITTHKAIMEAVGGTVHHDPGTGYPTDVLLAKVQAILNGTPTPTPKPPAPTPTPTPTDWFDMATKADLTAVVDERLKFYLPRMLNVIVNGAGNQAFPAGSTLALDGKGVAAQAAAKTLATPLNVTWDAKKPHLVSVASLLSALSLQTASNWTRVSQNVGAVSNVQAAVNKVAAQNTALAAAVNTVVANTNAAKAAGTALATQVGQVLSAVTKVAATTTQTAATTLTVGQQSNAVATAVNGLSGILSGLAKTLSPAPVVTK